MARFMGKLNTFFAYVASIILVFITVVICYTIFCRLVGLRAPIWVNQFSEYGLLFITFLGTAWLLSLERHTSVTLVLDLLPPRGRAVAKQVHMIVGALVCALLFWHTLGSVWDHHTRNVIDVGTIDVPKAWVLGVIPFGFLLLTIQFLLLLHKYRVAHKDMGRPGGPPLGSFAESMMAHSRGKGEC